MLNKTRDQLVYQNCLPDQKEKMSIVFYGRQFSFVQPFIKGIPGNIIPERTISNLDRVLRELV